MYKITTNSALILMLTHLILMRLPVLRAAAKSPKPDTAGAKVADLCGDARYTRFLGDKLIEDYNEALATVPALIKAADAYTLAASNPASPTTRTAMQVLAEVQTMEANAASQELATAKPHYDLAIKLLKQREGRLHAIIQSSYNQVTQTDGATISSGTVKGKASTVGCKATATLVPDQSKNCSLAREADHAVKYTDVNLQQATQLQHLTEDSLKHQKITAKAFGTGAATSATTASSNHHGFCVDDHDGPSLTSATAILGAEIEIEARTVRTQQTNLHASGDGNKCTATKITEAWGEQEADTLASVLCTIKQQKVAKRLPLHKQPLTNLEISVQIAEALNQVQSPGSPLTDDAKEKKQLVNKYFGSSDNEFKAKIEKAIETTEVDVTIGKTKIKKTPLALAGTDEGIKVLSYYHGKELAAKAETTVLGPVPTVAKETSDKCKTITDKEKCKAEDGCALKDEKCVAAQGKGQEKKEEHFQ
uniref:Variant surface glycoprotein 1125.1118 n=1 Tax=Trypanosoma brucei TaxID=5691 RepID=A0A1J0R6H9_9TRYP|nr:variant surface glycoprotein 1125.1118 [Trypanosoma brucei]